MHKKTKLALRQDNVQVAHHLDCNIELDIKIIDKIIPQSIECIKMMKKEGVKIRIVKDIEVALLILLEIVEEIKDWTKERIKKEITEGVKDVDLTLDHLKVLFHRDKEALEIIKEN